MVNSTETHTDCEEQERFLTNLIIGNERLLYDENIIFDESSEESVEYESGQNNARANWWSQWARDINTEARSSINQKGTRANAYYAPQIATCLLRDSSNRCRCYI